MDLDDELCLCFHVTKRKVINYLRVEQPARVGQLSDCFGAGTGCGWCRPFLRRLFDEARQASGELLAADSGSDPAAGDPSPAEPTKGEYARGRAGYIRSGGGVPPPGATPIDARDAPDLPDGDS